MNRDPVDRTDPLDDAFAGPGERLALALHMSGFDVNQIPPQVLNAGPRDSFEVVFERPDGGEFVLAYDGREGLIEVEETLRPDLPAERDGFALMLNTGLDPSLRIGKKPNTGALVVAAFLRFEKTDLSALAGAITSVCEIAAGLSKPDLGGARPPDDHDHLRGGALRA